jgi:hypothetical protein
MKDETVTRKHTLQHQRYDVEYVSQMVVVDMKAKH